MSDKIINPLKGITDKSWFFEQQIYDSEGIARAIKSTDGSGNASSPERLNNDISNRNEYGRPEHNRTALGVEGQKV